MGNEEAGETAKEGGGRLCLLLPFVSFHKPTRWFTPPCSGSIVLPPIVGGGKFLFKWGRWYSPGCPFLSILNGGGGIHAAPHFFPFQTGTACGIHAAPQFPSVSEQGGSANPTRCPPFYFISNGGGVNPTRCPGFFLFAPYEGGILY